MNVISRWIADPKRQGLWTFLHPRRAQARYEEALDCLIEAVKAQSTPEKEGEK